MIVCAVRDHINLQTYKKRANILLDIHKNQKVNITENMVNLNCATTVNYLLGKLFENHPSYEEIRMCPNCKIENKSKFITVIANLPTNSLQFLEDIIN